MQFFRVATVLFMAAATLGACSDDDEIFDEDDEFEEVEGSFGATNLTFTSTTDPTVTREIVAEGATFNLQIDRAGRFTSTFTDAGRTITRTGTVRFVDDDTFEFSDDPFEDDAVVAPRTFDFTRAGTRFTLESDDDEFDFDDDDIFDDAEFEAELEEIF